LEFFRILKINEWTWIPPNYKGSGVGLPPQDPEERGTPWVKGHPNLQTNKDCYLFFWTELHAFDRREYSRDPKVISPLIIKSPPPSKRLLRHWLYVTLSV